MKIKCYQINNELQMIPFEYIAALETIGQLDAKIWINLKNYESHELEDILDELGIQGFSKRFCLESIECPGFYPLKGEFLIVLPIQSQNEDSRTIEYLALLCRPESLFTFQKTSLELFQNKSKIQDSASWLPDNSIAGLVSVIILRLSMDSLQKTTLIRDRILILEHQLEHDPNTFKIEELNNNRTKLLLLETIVHGQIPILEALISTNRPAINIENTHEYLILAISNLKSADRTLEWLERRIDVMRSYLDTHAQDTMNRRLGRLTVLSMIFMPISFLAGIWGMNFNFMPGLTYRHGYLVALASMFFIAGGMFLYFRKKGWFD
jgi:magnesium transporter